MLKTNQNRIKIPEQEIKENIRARQIRNTNLFNNSLDQFLHKSSTVSQYLIDTIKKEGKILSQTGEPPLGDQSYNLISGILPNLLGYWKKPQMPLFHNRARYPLGGLSIHDIHQGHIGSCYLLSAVASILNIPTGIPYLNGIIERIDNNYLCVRLFYYEDTFDPEFKPAVVIIKDTLPEVMLNLATPHARTYSTTWFAYLEKAYSILRIAQDGKEYSAYSNIAGGHGYSVYQNVYGTDGTKGYDENDLKELIDEILPNLDKFPLTVAFKHNFTYQGVKYYHPHLYSVTDYKNDPGGESVQLFNPWGSGDKNNFSYMPLKTLTKNLQNYSACLMNVSSFANLTNYLDQYLTEPVKLIYIDQTSGEVKHKLI